MTLENRPIPSSGRGRVAPRAILLALALVLSGCGGEGDTAGSRGQDGVAAVAGRAGENGLTTLTTIALEPAGLNCAPGGNRISAGLDINADGVLEASEVSSVQYVCNGATGAVGARGATGASGATGATGPIGPTGATGANGGNGTNGLNTLIVLGTEPVGANCTQGGTQVSAGFDADANGLLDASEVVSVSYVCNGATGAIGATGATGATGANGTDGAAGASGTNGTDGAPGATGAVGANGAPGAAGADGAAGPTGATGETGVPGPSGIVGATGAAGPTGAIGATGDTGTSGHNSLALLIDEAAGANCPYAGKKVTSGIDTNDSGELDGGEVQATAYVCNGAPGPGLTFVAITADIQAASSMGYVANSASPLVVTLPLSPAVGDIVDVTGAGPGGFRIAQNAGQAISIKGLDTAAAVLPGGVWQSTASIGAPNQILGSASSASGQKVVATGSASSIAIAFLSNDYGRTFTQSTGLPTGTGTIAYQVASSANGNILVAALYPTFVYVSLDSGVTWTNRSPVANGVYPVAISADGLKMYAGGRSSRLMYSSDSGVTWTASTLAPHVWRGITTSADGVTVYAAPDDGNLTLFKSTDSGATFTGVGPLKTWQNVGTSTDGTTVAAVPLQTDNVYVSTDSGATWTARGPSLLWSDVRVSGDGLTMFATQARTGAVAYYSRDGGVTWTAGTTLMNGSSVTHASMSTDAKFFFAAGSITAWTSPGTTTSVGVAGYLEGSQFDAISLQFVGAGLWIPLNYASFSGTFVVQ